MAHHLRTTTAVASAGLLLAMGVATATPVGASAATATTAATPPCRALSDPVYQVIKPTNGASLITPWLREASAAASHGFSGGPTVLFRAALTPGPGLVAVHRLYRGAIQDFLATSDPGEIDPAHGGAGYQDQGAMFYGLPGPG